MSNQYRYTFLMSSLPRFKKHYEGNSTVISKPRLYQRLKALTPDDAHLLNGFVEDFLFLVFDETFEDTNVPSNSRIKAQRHTARLDDKNNIGLYQLLHEISVIRFLLSVLVSEKYQIELIIPAWIDHSFCWYFIKHWQTNKGRMLAMFPYLEDAQHLVINDHYKKLEDLKINRVWTVLNRQSFNNTYGINAVVLYVLQWYLVSRQLSSDNVNTAEFIQNITSEVIDAYTL